MDALLQTALRPPWREPVLTAAVMVALLAVNLILANLPLGRLGSALIVAFAGVQAALVLWVTMEVRRGEGLLKLFALFGLFFVAVMFAISLIDYLTR